MLAVATFPNTRFILLTQGEFAIVDEEDFALVSGHKWAVYTSPELNQYAVANVATGLFYERRVKLCGEPYQKARRKMTSLRMHRLIMGVGKGAKGRGIMIDHINHDGLDNRRANLENRLLPAK